MKLWEREHLRISDLNSSYVKPLIHFEQLEPRILLSGDNLLNIVSSPQQDTILDNTSLSDQYVELPDTEEQISIELAPSGTSNIDVYQPIFTFLIDDNDNTNDESIDRDLSIDNMGSAQLNSEITLLLDGSDGDIESKVVTTENDGGTPTYIDADLSKEYSTSIEIRSPPATETVTLSGMHLVDPNFDNINGQNVYLDFDGEENVTYNGPVTVEGIDVPAFLAPGDLAGQEQIIITEVLGSLEHIFAGSGIIFTTEQPSGDQLYSTIYVGGDDSAFTEYGSFLGLAEQVDVGNKNRSDNAFVFSDKTVSNHTDLGTLVTHLTNLLSHETGHLLGYEHDNEDPNGGVLSSVMADRFEPNDSFAAATDLGILGGRTETGLTIHESYNDDYYLLTAADSGTLNVDILFSHSLGDLDLYVYNSSQSQQASSTTTTDNESVSVGVTSGQTYYVHVLGYGGATHPNYELVIDVIEGPEIPADRFEPNDSFVAATDLGILGDRTEGDLTIHESNSDDYYLLTAADSGTLNVEILFSHSLGDLDLHVYDSSQSLNASSASSTDNESVSVAVTSGQTYYVHVYGYEGAIHPDYDLVIDGPVEPERDFGDAPDSYQTLLASDGARHIYNPDFFLGNGVDIEANGQPSPPGLGDDYNGDDEDGVNFTSALIPGQWASVQVEASTEGMLDAWIDFNADGSFTEPDDQIFDAQWLNSGTNNLSFWVPETATGGISTYTRFRFSEGGGLAFYGKAGNGEVEDYAIELTIDTTAPVVTVDTLLTNDNTPPLTGTVNDPTAVILVTVAGNTYSAANNGDGTWTLPDDTISPPLADGNYDVAVTATDPAGNIGTDSSFNELTVSSQLRVDSLEVIPSGFIAHFNRRQIDLDVLNLYDTGAGIHGPADFTVVGDSVGLVAGSLICGEDGTIVSFIKTGGPLMPDTYTITLRSGADAFKDTEGHLLDGDADDVEGGDYVTTVIVEPATARLLSLPDFTRGPGQDINVPATDSGIPLTISDGNNVQTLDFVFEYDPDLLNVTGMSLGTNVSGDWNVVYNLEIPGQIPIVASGTTPLSAGEVRLLDIQADIPNDAVYASSAVLRLSNIQVNEGIMETNGDSSVQVVAYFGDTTGNHSYSGLDAAYIARVAIGFDSGFAAYRLIDPVIVADVTGNGHLSGLDAAYVARKAIGFEQPQIPDLPNPLPGIVAGGRDPLLSIPENLTAQWGSTITIPVLLDDATGLSLAEIDLQYDTNIFDLTNSDVRLGNLTSGRNPVSNVNDSTGQIKMVLYSLGLFTGGSGSLVELEFFVRVDATLGTTIIDLMDTCKLNDGALILTLQDGELLILEKRDQTTPIPVPVAEISKNDKKLTVRFRIRSVH